MEQLLAVNRTVNDADGKLVIEVVPSSSVRNLSVRVFNGSLNYYPDDSVDNKIKLTGTTNTVLDVKIPIDAKFITFCDFETKSEQSSVYINASVTNSILKRVVSWESYPWYLFTVRNSISLVDVPDTIWPACRSANAMFQGCDSFDSPSVSTWDVSNIDDFSYMFANTKKFNQDINSWRFKKGARIQGMLRFAEAFNKPLNEWDMSQFTSLEQFFYACYAFNQDISSWDISNVNNISSMFSFADKFNQDLSSWVFQKGTNNTNYDNGITLTQWPANRRPVFL